MSGEESFTLPPDEESALRLWWHVLRPDRLRIADEIDRTARAYRRSPETEEALRHVARWLRACAGEPDSKPDESALPKWERLIATFSGGDS